MRWGHMRLGSLIGSILLFVLGAWLFPLDALGVSQPTQTLKVTPNKINFGDVLINTKSDPKSFTVTYTSNIASTVRVDILSNCARVKISPTTTELDTGEGVSVNVTLNRIPRPGSFLCSIIILANDVFGKSRGQGKKLFASVEVQANITSPKLVISRINSNKRDTEFKLDGGKLTVNLKELDLFERVTLDLKLRNAGNADMDLQVSCPSDSDVVVQGCTTGTRVPRGGDTAIKVIIQSIKGGPIQAKIIARILSPKVPPSIAGRIQIRIEGTGNMIFIRPNSSFLIFNAQVPGGFAAALDSVVEAQATTRQTLTLRHQGKGKELAGARVELEIRDVTHQPRQGGSRSSRKDLFRFADGALKKTIILKPGKSARLQIVYSPVQPGLDQGVIRVTVFQQKGKNKGKRIQEFFVNLRGFATPSAQSQTLAESRSAPLTIHHWGVEQFTPADWRFFAQGQGIAALRAEVFTLTGQRVYDSSFIAAEAFTWHPTTAAQALANGIYLYRLTIRGQDGTKVQTEIRRVVLLR